jgi:hypothetical protein
MGILEVLGLSRKTRNLREFNLLGESNSLDLDALLRDFFNSGITELDRLVQLLLQDSHISRDEEKSTLQKQLQDDVQGRAKFITEFIVRFPIVTLLETQQLSRMNRYRMSSALAMLVSTTTEEFWAALDEHFNDILIVACRTLIAYSSVDRSLATVLKNLMERTKNLPDNKLKKAVVSELFQTLDNSDHVYLSGIPNDRELRQQCMQLIGTTEKSSRFHSLDLTVEAEFESTISAIRGMCSNFLSEILLKEDVSAPDLNSVRRVDGAVLYDIWLSIDSQTPAAKGKILSQMYDVMLFKKQLEEASQSGSTIKKALWNKFSRLRAWNGLTAAARNLSKQKLEFDDADLSKIVKLMPHEYYMRSKKILNYAFAICGKGGYPLTTATLILMAKGFADNTASQAPLFDGFAAKIQTMIEARGATVRKYRTQSTPLRAAFNLPIVRVARTPERQAYRNKIKQSLHGHSDCFANWRALEFSDTELEFIVDLLIESSDLRGKTAPTTKWLKNSVEQFAKLPEFPSTFSKLFGDYFDPDAPPSAKSDELNLLLRAMAYLSRELPIDVVGTKLSNYARKVCYVTEAGVGIHNEKLGNVCLWALINRADGAGVPYLARLLVRIKYPKIKKRIEVALEEAAMRAGVSRGALEEMALADHGLNSAGACEFNVADGLARISVNKSRKVGVLWQKQGGKWCENVPEALKKDKTAVKTVRNVVKEIETDLSVLVQRIQQTWLEDRRWSTEEWLATYANHPLRSPFASSLIWDMVRDGRRTSVIWNNGEFVDTGGQTIALDCGSVRLWHPVSCPTAETLAWRKRLRELEITQPFKQAHREVYLVTDAELRAGTYSNRFAGHIIKQHQFMTLARLNNWRVTHKMWVDAPNDELAHIVLRAYGLVAEYWTEGAGGDYPEVADSLAYLYLSTDQLRFHKLAEGAAGRSDTAHGPGKGDLVRIEDVPPIVLSEIMRHCDLFVGVCSVANDPNWADAGRAALHPNQWRRDAGQTYWHREAVATLSASAETRREVIADLLPSLRIGFQCYLDDKFLHVKGKLRSYKIHLGSGNILMNPNDAYLCIVQSSRNAFGDKVRLPFEGDNMLSVILSKAFLLADDINIADPSILSQIKRQ